MLPELTKPKELSAAIKELRLSRNMTQEEFASKLDVSVNTVASYEAFGRKNFAVPRPAIYNQINHIFFGGIRSRSIGKKVPQLSVVDATDEELIRELKSRGVSWIRYARTK